MVSDVYICIVSHMKARLSYMTRCLTYPFPYYCTWILTGACVEYVKSFNKPMLLLGGGGYTVRNVSRCWAFETSVAVGLQLNDELPYNQYYEYYGPDFTLHIPASNMENLNTPKYLEKQKNVILQMLNELPHIPSVPYSTPIPRDPEFLTELREQQESDEEEKRSDIRTTLSDSDKRIQAANEYYDTLAGDRGDNDEAYLTRGTHRNPIDPAQQFYMNQATLPNISNEGGPGQMDTT
jgi:histone deacetylase 1/2